MVSDSRRLAGVACALQLARKCHFEWHSARMGKPVTRHFADVERLFCREQVSGLRDFADQVGGKVAAGVGALARLLSKAHVQRRGSGATRLSYRGRVHSRRR